MFMNFVESNITESNTLQIIGETGVFGNRKEGLSVASLVTEEKILV